MTSPPQASPEPGREAARYRPDPRILTLGEDFYDPVSPAAFPKHLLRFRNDRRAAEVGLAELDDDAWIAHFGRFEPLPDNLPQPLALRYHGHQFRAYNPDIGDGRGFLFAQLRDARGRLLDLGTKGSGTTPYSRFGDGRLTLKGGVREVLATEMLEALGVHTSKSFSLIETGEALHRGDEPSPARSAVLVRLSHGHIRIGAFQRLAYLRQPENIAKLAAYSLEQLYGESVGDEPAAQLLGHVVRGGARLAASYIAAGFVHGVLNSDNIAITTESFDYGPWRFTPLWEPGFTAAYFDHNGLYAFGRQAEAIYWDIAQLASSLRTIAGEDILLPALEAFPATYQATLREMMLDRLGVKPRGEQADLNLLAAIERGLSTSGVEIDRFFFDWAGGRRRGPSSADPLYAAPDFADFVALVGDYAPARGLDHPYWSDPAPCSMHIEEVEAIWARIAEADDWTAFEAKIAAIRRMGAAIRSGSLPSLDAQWATPV